MPVRGTEVTDSLRTGSPAHRRTGSPSEKDSGPLAQTVIEHRLDRVHHTSNFALDDGIFVVGITFEAQRLAEVDAVLRGQRDEAERAERRGSERDGERRAAGPPG